MPLYSRIAALLVLFLLTTASRAHAPSTDLIGKVSFLLGKIGEVVILRPGNAGALPAKLKMDIVAGDRIQTQAESRCEVKLADGSVMRIGEQSLLDFGPSRVAKNDRQFEGSLLRGRLWSNIASLVWGKEKFEVKSPTAVCAIRGTIYSMAADSTTRIAVYDGEVQVGPTQALRQQLQQQAPRPGAPQPVPGPTRVPGPTEVTLDQWVRLVAGYQMEIKQNGRYAQSRLDEQQQQQDDWVRWNRERDQELGELE